MRSDKLEATGGDPEQPRSRDTAAVAFPWSMRWICACAAGAVVAFLASGFGAPPDLSNHPPVLGSDTFGMTPKAKLGRALFFDTTLSTPVGQSCASCHEPAAGFTFPDSEVNRTLGVAPGVVAGRFGSRAVPQVSYASFNPDGPPFLSPFIALYVGGQFWDGRAVDLVDQAKSPFVNPNEMNNLTHNLGDPSLVVQKVAQGAHAGEFRAIFGSDVFSRPTGLVYEKIAEAIAEYEKSSEVSPFSSRYDAWRAGLVEFTDQELLGLRLFTGSWTGRTDGGTFPRFSHCVECHSIPSIPAGDPDLWTNTCYQNIGVPRNPGNPFYTQTDAGSNPVGYNPLGAEYVDYGLGDFFYSRLGLPRGNVGPGSDGRGDFIGVNGLFKAPSLRNVDKRPSPAFVKAYMHNGVFKSLEEVVHFYNTRNLTTTPGEIINFELDDPYAGLQGTPLWGAPEYPSIDTLLNPAGDLGMEDHSGTGTGGESTAQVGNLGLTGDEEAAIVAFLRTLSDGYFHPELQTGCLPIVSQPVAQRTCRGSSARITVAARSIAPVTYQWRRNGVPLPGETNSFFTAVIATLDQTGVYDCVLTSTCGSVTSRAVRFDVCAGDFNCDGQNDESDVSAYLEAFFAEDPAADLDGDGVTDFFDYDAFMAAHASGC